MTYTATTTRKWLRKHGTFAHFIPRSRMVRKHPMRCIKNDFSVPATQLPVDCTGNATVQCPMDGNDQYGDCGEAMVAHHDNILTFGQGKSGWTQSSFALAALVAQYLKTSGGDNGMDEDMLVGPQGIWTPAGGGIAGNSAAVVVDSLDIGADPEIQQYCIDQFYATDMAWSVPDAFIQEFYSGVSFLSPMTPDPNNGHYTPLSDIDQSGNYRLWTWGGWCWTSPSFIASVEPVFFTVFSARQFNLATGYDSHGRHITTQAAAWEAMGGKAIPASVISMFPPAGGPVTPPPVHTGLSLASIITILEEIGKKYKRYKPAMVLAEDDIIAAWDETLAKKAS